MGLKKSEDKTLLVCMRCGHVEEAKKPAEKKTAEVPVIESPTEKALPTTKIECPKCGNDKAFWWMQQTRSADEPSTRFYKCTKCGHVWREYA